VASHEFLFVSTKTRLLALNLGNGKLEWSQKMKRAGTLTIADGKLFLAMGSGMGDTDGGELAVFTTGEKEKEKDPGTVPALVPPPSR
jgi:outer membrane protein assembly factor BamB